MKIMMLALTMFLSVSSMAASLKTVNTLVTCADKEANLKIVVTSEYKPGLHVVVSAYDPVTALRTIVFAKPVSELGRGNLTVYRDQTESVRVLVTRNSFQSTAEISIQESNGGIPYSKKNIPCVHNSVLVWNP